jgi:hypothetical protein
MRADDRKRRATAGLHLLDTDVHDLALRIADENGARL